MDEYTQLDYLRNSRVLYYNDDYIGFLVKTGLEGYTMQSFGQVSVLHPHMEEDGKDADAPGEDREAFMNNLMERGATHQEAAIQYENERLLSMEFNTESYLTYAPNMKITFGTVTR